MARAKKMKSGNFRCLVYSHTDPGGKRRYKSFTAPTKKEAEYMAAEYIMNRDKRKDIVNWTLGEAIDQYIELKRSVLAPSAVYRYENIRKRSFQDIMDIPLKKLTDDILQESVNKEMTRTAYNRTWTVAPKTVQTEYGLISSTLNRFIPNNEFEVDLPKVPKKIRSLPLPEDIYNAVHGTNVELPVMLAMWLSFTVSEVRGLTKSKSIDGDYLTIREVLVRVGGEDVRQDLAKEEDRIRRLRMPEYIKNLIDQVEGDVIVPISEKAVSYRFQKHMKMNGIFGITFHDLRHVNASTMAVLQIPDKYAQERGGWKTDYVMKRVYTETFTEERQRVDNLMDEYFNKFVLSES